MIFSDTIIEKKKIFLRNLNIKNIVEDEWSSPNGGYPFYGFTTEIPFGINNLYYGRATVKYTTTNQSPTWIQFYLQSGTQTITGMRQNNPVVNTEYTISGIGSCLSVTDRSNSVNLTSTCNIYAGNSDAINGMQAQAKNVLLYDVTELYKILQQENICSTTAELKTWCDENLEYVPRYTNYDITELINNILNKVVINKGTILADQFVEPKGMNFYSITNYSNYYRNNQFFDNTLNVDAMKPYIGSASGTTNTIEIVEEAQTENSPFWQQHPNLLKMTTTHATGAVRTCGVYCTSTSANSSKVFLIKIIAKFATTQTIYATGNSVAENSLIYLSSRKGTGDWAEYSWIVRFSGSSGAQGHCYLTGPSSTESSWYIAFYGIYNIIDHEELKNFTILPNVERIKAGNLFTNELNTLNLFPNKKIEKYTLPTKWSLDYDDVIDGAEFSIVQDVNAGAYVFPEFISIIPGQRYKISYWVKCKQDMTSFLTALYYINPSSTSDGALEHANVNYVNGTYVKLTEALNSGDTSMTVNSNTSWTIRTCKLGFRSNDKKSYNDLGTSSSIAVSGKTGTTVVNFSSAYSGATIAANKYVVEAYAGGTYPYPIIKSQLPTDNEWKYVEGYFGQNSLWNGAVTSGSWQNIPFDVRQMRLQLNLYTNTGTVPIKYCNIKIEPIKAGSLIRNEQKIQIIGGN